MDESSKDFISDFIANFEAESSSAKLNGDYYIVRYIERFSICDPLILNEHLLKRSKLIKLARKRRNRGKHFLSKMFSYCWYGHGILSAHTTIKTYLKNLKINNNEVLIYDSPQELLDSIISFRGHEEYISAQRNEEFIFRKYDQDSGMYFDSRTGNVKPPFLTLSKNRV